MTGDLDGGEVAALLGSDGAFAHNIPDFMPRQAQQDMARAVAEAFTSDSALVVEAGTGTGKTFAYLVPALMSGKRVVVSTGTRNLQDQLFHRDLPRVREALQVPVRTALLKGRSNYLCLYRMKRASSLPGLRLLRDRLSQIEDWARTTQSGDVAELGQLDEADPLTRQITSTADNCLGSKCADFNGCFVVRARRAAQAAELVVINHHLLFADFVLKEEGFGQILSGTDACIIDEAHQLPELAAAFFGERVSTRQLQELSKDAQAGAQQLADIAPVQEAAEVLAGKATALEAAFSQLPGRMTLAEFLQRRGVDAVLEEARTALETLFDLIRPYEERSAEMAACVERAADLMRRCALILETAAARAAPDPDPERVRWVEPAGRGGSLHATPIQVAEGFRRMVATYPGAWIFTSATLAAREDFSLFSGQLGLDGARALRLDSPFDYAAQARLYLPRGLPEPSDPAYPDAVADAALPVIEASGGGVFVLCTSYKALRRIAERLRPQLRHRLFVQGEDNRAALLQAFTEDGNAVLIGTSSFWEGVDVKGRALRVVIIDKLPFAAPGDPVFEARLEAIRKSGGSPFSDYQLPQAIMTLRQGVGRLIRDIDDRGLLMLCDPRLRGKSYGKRVLASLPKMPLLDQPEAVQEWLATL